VIGTAARRRAAAFAAALTLLSGVGCAGRIRAAVGPGSAVPSPAVRALRRDLDRTFGAPAFDRVIWAVEVRSLETGELLHGINPSKLVMPASNMKILTLAAAAERLGWDFTFETRLFATGPIVGGVLQGDLVVAATGDPTINGRGGSAQRVFEAWADRLREAGITTIAGRLVGDGRSLAREALGQGWAWDYLSAGYAAPVSALQYNENVVEVVIQPGAAAGTPASIEVRPGDSGLTIDGVVTTTAAGGRASVSIERLPGSSRLQVTGSVPAGSDAITRTASVDDPSQFYVQELQSTLVEKGIVIRSSPALWTQVQVLPDEQSMRLIFTHRSPPLSEIAITLMKVSQNLYAETLLRALGVRGGAGTVAEGQRLVREVLGGWGIPPDGYVLADGSGLSRYNYVTAETIVEVLRRMATDPRHSAAFEAALPVVGKDGTLARRMQGTPAEGNAKAKTGSIANVRALSGYVTTRDGERLVFSIIANNFNVPAETVDAAADAAVVRLAEFSRRNSSASPAPPAGSPREPR